MPAALFRLWVCGGAWRARRGACDDNSRVRIALDATYSLGKNLSGVGVYSREMMSGLARAHPDESFRFYYSPHRLFKSLSEKLPPNASRRLLTGAPRADLFHALNQRVDRRSRRTVCTFHDLFVMTGEYSSPEFRARFDAQKVTLAEGEHQNVEVKLIPKSASDAEIAKLQ